MFFRNEFWRIFQQEDPTDPTPTQAWSNWSLSYTAGRWAEVRRYYGDDRAESNLTELSCLIIDQWYNRARKIIFLSIFPAARSPVFFSRDKVCLTAQILQQSPKFVPLKLIKLLRTITEVKLELLLLFDKVGQNTTGPTHHPATRTFISLTDWLSDLILGVSWTGFNSKWWPGCTRSRAATLLLMKSLEHHSNSLNSEISSNQSAANSGSVAAAQNSFNKFSRSKGYYSQVLRVSWNIIGRRVRGSLQHLTISLFNLTTEIDPNFELNWRCNVSFLNVNIRQETHS